MNTETNVESTQTDSASVEVIETPVTDSASVRKLFGQALDKEYSIDVTYNKLADNSAIPTDSEFTHQEKIDILNARRKATARAQATADLAEKLGVKKPGVLDSDEGRIAHFVKGFMSMGQDRETATAHAKAALGIS